MLEELITTFDSITTPCASRKPVQLNLLQLNLLQLNLDSSAFAAGALWR